MVSVCCARVQSFGSFGKDLWGGRNEGYIIRDILLRLHFNLACMISHIDFIFRQSLGTMIRLSRFLPHLSTISLGGVSFLVFPDGKSTTHSETSGFTRPALG
jgi:hypothetical protein